MRIEIQALGDQSSSILTQISEIPGLPDGKAEISLDYSHRKAEVKSSTPPALSNVVL